jgi:phosphoribosylanthranilate isomerase/hypoxanthine phosphoribosyltransferase
MEKKDVYKEVVEAITKLDLVSVGLDDSNLNLAIPTTTSKLHYQQVLLQSLKHYSLGIGDYSNIITELLNNRDGLDNLDQLYTYFDKATGSIILPLHDIPDSYSHFYTSARRDNRHGSLLSRGASYYSNSNPSLTAKHKIFIIATDVKDALSLIGNIKRETDKDLLPYYIGVIDYAKSGIITLLHALTFRERSGDYDNTEEYLSLRANLVNQTQLIVRYFYQTIMGLHPDTIDTDLSIQIIDEVYVYLQQQTVHENEVKQPELDNPVIILEAAIRFTLNFQDIDILVGLPSGGTELSILTKYIMELVYRRELGMFLLPISRYSLTRVTNNSVTDDGLVEYLKDYSNLITGKSLLILDDNSNTGLTADLAVKSINRYLPKNVNFQVAELDIYRTAVKNTQWEKQPDTISNPYIFKSAVSFVPITYKDKQLKDFKQIRKLERLSVLHRYYVSVLPLADVSSISLPEDTGTQLAIKACAIHNVPDLESCLRNGINWIGVHLTYLQEKYRSKLKAANDPTGIISNVIYNEYYRIGDLPIPWLEYESIKNMINYIHLHPGKVNLVLLARLDSEKDIIDMIDNLIPQDFNKTIYLQLQNEYSQDKTSALIDSIKKYHFPIKLIQTVGANLTNAQTLITQINNDSDIDFLLIDTKQEGGTGVESDDDRIMGLASLSTKRFFIAGGLSNKNIPRKLLKLWRAEKLPFGIDLESSIELETPNLLNYQSIPIKRRKDPKKIEELVETVSEAESLLWQAQDYNDLYIRDTAFWKTLETAWKESFDQHGYYNLNHVANSFLRLGSQSGLLNESYIESNESFIQLFTNAAVNYPHIPEIVLKDTNDKQRTYARSTCTHWQVLGAAQFLFELIESTHSHNGVFSIWTSGDNANLSKELGLKCVDEQLIRFRRSGLENELMQLGKSTISNDFEFLAHPFKLNIFEERLKNVLPGTQVFVIEDNLNNLNSCIKIASNRNVDLIPILKTDDLKEVKDMQQFTDLTDIAKFVSDKIVNQSIIFCDMDGVLLHEGFRSGHQGKNIYIELMKSNLLHNPHRQ